MLNELLATLFILTVTLPAVQSTTFIANLPHSESSYQLASTDKVPVLPVVCSIQLSVNVRPDPTVRPAAEFSNLGLVILCQYNL